MPGDIVVADREGVTSVPPYLVPAVVKQAKPTELHDSWTKGKFGTGRYEVSELYPNPQGAALHKEYADWPLQKKRELDLE